MLTWKQTLKYIFWYQFFYVFLDMTNSRCPKKGSSINLLKYIGFKCVIILPGIGHNKLTIGSSSFRPCLPLYPKFGWIKQGHLS